MQKIILYMVVAAAMGLTGCVPAVQLQSTFDEEHAQQLLEPGTATIKGSSLIRQRGGGVVTCAGDVVRLIPATQYAQEIMKAKFGNTTRGFREVNDFSGAGFGGIHFQNLSPLYDILVRETACDVQGYFNFNGVSSGRFYVTTMISWEVATSSIYSFSSSTSTEGGELMQLVEINDGETKEIVLTP